MKITKRKLILIAFVISAIAAAFIYFKYVHNSSQKKEEMPIPAKKISVTIFDVNGRILKKWFNVKNIREPKNNKSFIIFNTEKGKFVQIPDSVWYVIEEE